jgi:hypothetical protein
MTETNKRTVQQQRIQQLQERLELYNAAAVSRSETTSSAGATGNVSGASAAAAAANVSRNCGKPMRAPPPINSPNPTPQTTPAAGATDSMFKSPLTASGAPSGKAKTTVPTTSTTAGAGKVDTSRISPQSQTHHQTPPPPPAPAPRLARNLAEDFKSSAVTSPVGGPSRAKKATTSSFAAATAAADASAHSTTSPLRASDVFGLYNESEDEEGEDAHHGGDGDASEYMEYEVEEVEEYDDDDEEEDDDYSEDGDEERYGKESIGGPPPTLDSVLRRIFRAYSGSPDRHGAGPQSDRATTASPPAHDPSLGSSSATRVAPAASAVAGGGDGVGTSSSSHPLIQRAAELYRQHRLHQAQQLHHSTFHAADGSGSRGYTTLHRDPEDTDESSMSTSEPSAERHDDTGSSDLSTTSGSSESYLSPAAAYAALGGGNAATRAAAAAAAASVRTSASPSPPVTSSASSAPSQQVNAASSVAASLGSASAFDQLEVAYRQLLLLQRGVEYAVERAGIQHFPQPLPHQDKAQALAQQRTLLVQKDAEMRAAPPSGASLVDVRNHEAAALEAAVASIDAKFAAALQLAKPVMDRGTAVEEKRRLLNQREHDLAQQREARIIVEREVTKIADTLGERKEKLKKREVEYNAQLQQHDEQQKAAQQQISEVEQLSKQVSSWLAILEERDRRLTRKEKRLQRVQADLIRRSEDVAMWKKATQRVKQIPPPPSPPRIIN